MKNVYRPGGPTPAVINSVSSLLSKMAWASEIRARRPKMFFGAPLHAGIYALNDSQQWRRQLVDLDTGAGRLDKMDIELLKPAPDHRRPKVLLHQLWAY